MKVTLLFKSFRFMFSVYGYVQDLDFRDKIIYHSRLPLCFCNDRLRYVSPLACFPVVGQILGIFMIIIGAQYLFQTFCPENHCVEKFIKRSIKSFIARGCITFLGLGIVCLLLDIMVTVFVLIKKSLNKNNPIGHVLVL